MSIGNRWMVIPAGHGHWCYAHMCIWINVVSRAKSIVLWRLECHESLLATYLECLDHDKYSYVKSK